VDSGTSLIAVPSTMLVELAMAIGNVKEDCSNVKELPSVEFTLEGQTFLLPPEMYIIRVRDDSSGLTAMEMAKLQNSPFGVKGLTSKLKGRGGEVCMAGFMEMDAITNDGPMMILGVPFLRAFAAQFDRAKKTISLAQIPVGSQKCAGCSAEKEVPASGSKSGAKADLLPFAGELTASAQLPAVSLDKLRVPWWAAAASAANFTAGAANLTPAHRRKIIVF
jgi:hypothetical protein